MENLCIKSQIRVNYWEQNPSNLRILISIGDYYEQTGIFISTANS